MTNQLPVRPSARDKVYDVIDGEREYQQATHPASPTPSITEFASLIDEYAVKLVTPFAESPQTTVNGAAAQAKVAQKRFREIAAIAVHAMEVYGAVPRENHVPASAGITGTLHVKDLSDKTASPAAPAHAATTAPAAPAHAATTAPAAPAHTEASPAQHHEPVQHHEPGPHK